MDEGKPQELPMKQHRKSFKKEELVRKILEKMSVTDMARQLYPNVKDRRDALKQLNYWLRQEMMPVEKYEKMMDILRKTKKKQKPLPYRMNKYTKNTHPKSLDEIPRRLEQDFPDERYQILAAAIVGTAASDYTKAGVYLKQGKRNEHAENTAMKHLRQCEQFFLGTQFPILMNAMDGESFKEKLDDKIERGETFKFVYSQR